MFFIYISTISEENFNKSGIFSWPLRLQAKRVICKSTNSGQATFNINDVESRAPRYFSDKCFNACRVATRVLLVESIRLSQKHNSIAPTDSNTTVPSGSARSDFVTRTNLLLPSTASLDSMATRFEFSSRSLLDKHALNTSGRSSKALAMINHPKHQQAFSRSDWSPAQ